MRTTTPLDDVVGTVRARGPAMRPSASDARALSAARDALAIAFGPVEQRGFAIRLWDDSMESPASGASFTLVVRRPGALRRALLPPSELALVEAYLRDDLDAEGDLAEAGRLGDLAAARLRSPRALTRLVRALTALPRDDGVTTGHDADASSGGKRRAASLFGIRRHTKRRDADAVRHHYDVGNDFYALWLDRRSIYSCAYFPTGTEDLDAAQEAKLEHICRKLRLRPGEHLLDVGCGWGGLLEYAATRHGVTGVGITLSEPQASGARARLAAAGVGDAVRIEVRDYRELPSEWRFDKAVSVGMREHVGSARLPDYFAAVSHALRPGGLFLDHGLVRGGAHEEHGIGTWIERQLWRRDAFIQRYVFPDGELAPLGTLLGIAERTGLEVRDVENLREHYGLTLRWWVHRLEHAHERAAAIVGEHTYRVWRLYMAATRLAFRSGRMTLIQTLLAKPLPDGSVTVPLSRADLYRA